jgi:histidine kinase/DNA gyrase B/HSP90-like ATPase
MKRINVEVQPDHLQSIANVKRPLAAVAELIWNGLDADANEVRVDLFRNNLDGLTRVFVQDNGAGLPYAQSETAFQNLGGSWKKNATRTPGGRLLHGQLGRGRFKAFGIGSSVLWHSKYRDNGVVHEFTISGSSGNLDEFEISDPSKTTDTTSGMSVDVSVHKNYTSLLDEKARDELAEEFALYLLQYPNVKIIYDGKTIDPNLLIDHVADYDLGDVALPDGTKITATLTAIEWKRTTDRALYLCDESGVTLHKMNVGIQAPGFEFTAYLKSSYIRGLDASGGLFLEAVDPGLNALVEASRKQLREHFRRRAAEQTTGIVEEWKREHIYPYEGEPKSVIETAERQVFDVVALNVNSYLPDFETANKNSKKLSLQLIRHALERDPGELQLILDDVLSLPAEKRKELAELLQKTTLASIISASKIVADRLNFIRGLETLVFEKESKEALLERRQLHRILASETWIFGEQFHIAVDDESLDEVLAKHLELLGREMADDTAVLDEHGKVCIVDLMLSKRIPLPNPEHRQHLIVELKRPTQDIDLRVQNQVIKYAKAISKDERFRDTRTEWHLWAVSNDIEDSVRDLANQKDRPAGLLFQSPEGNVYVWAKTWGQIVQECKGRLEFFQSRLQYQADRASGLEYLRVTHDKYLPKTLKSPPTN